jgi:tetratricopeptide (TPR) repeat protein
MTEVMDRPTLRPTNDLGQAIAHHQAGRLDQAALLYQQLLARNANHADALHLLGVLVHQRGNPTEAVALIGRAIAVNAGVAAFHCNRGEAYRALGQYDRAVACCRIALGIKPTYAEAANNLGLALLGQGNILAAVEQLRNAAKLQPDVAMIHSNLGNAVRLQGDLRQAMVHFHQALRIDPSLAEAHSNLGQALLERNRRRPALRHCREAVRIRPDFAEAHSNLGNVLRELGQLADAKKSYTEALRLSPNLAIAFNNMGQAFQEEGDLRQASAWYRQGLERDSSSIRIHCNLASALAEQENYDQALTHYRIALGLEPDSAEAHNGLGLVLHEQGKYQEAVAEYREVLRLKPGYAAGHCSLGNLLEELGNFDEALGSFRTAIRHDPDHTAAYAMMATMLRGKLPEEDEATICRFLGRLHMAPGKRAALHFGLAHVLDARGEYASAGRHVVEGNRLTRVLHDRRGQTYDPQQHQDFVDGLVAGFSPEFFGRVRGFGIDSERPIFIVGLPRSGTTLTEQILASHSQVFGAGEQSHARESFESLPRVLGRPGPPLACLEHLDRQSGRGVAQAHLDRLSALDAAKPRVVDKMPDNYLQLGLLATLFPRARLIHCRRDLRDVAVSCWMTNFKHLRWSADPEHIGSRFAQYRRVMDHWRQTLPVPLFEVDYEETVADLEGVARRLIAWCGLEWEPQCLAFHETKRPVRTASVTQVRQPIYTRSVARWKHYQPILGDLFAQLEALNSV